MNNVIPIHSRRTFTKEDAEQILPIIKRITDRSACTLDDLKEELHWTPKDEPGFNRLKQELDLVVTRWATKVSRLGCEPKGIWLVDFDSGDGCFSWRYGDEDLSFFHPHELGIDDLLQSMETNELPS